MNRIRIGGRNMFPPPILSILQTNGSFYYQTGLSRIAYILKTPNEVYQHTQKIQPAETSTETEWASIAIGLSYALEKGHVNIAIENDNLGVVSALISKKTLKHDYAKYYQEKILTMAENTLWTGIRWIPKVQNRADDLF